ncbi:uncharacterized protein B0T15DRAFT_104306 [Chaetomium strumarium]|uniref:Secreted protein n=1 Tax=Chaetomium strumarium TaxID=1170767 RepID=A0AAJ0M428_9PEZI|nr:hypothetical protein B0T15DRAFT_104306 [Chaetomium strumarium]
MMGGLGSLRWRFNLLLFTAVFQLGCSPLGGQVGEMTALCHKSRCCKGIQWLPNLELHVHVFRTRSTVLDEHTRRFLPDEAGRTTPPAGFGMIIASLSQRDSACSGLVPASDSASCMYMDPSPSFIPVVAGPPHGLFNRCPYPSIHGTDPYMAFPTAMPRRRHLRDLEKSRK